MRIDLHPPQRIRDQEEQLDFCKVEIPTVIDIDNLHRNQPVVYTRIFREIKQTVAVEVRDFHPMTHDGWVLSHSTLNARPHTREGGQGGQQSDGYLDVYRHELEPIVS